MVDVPQPPENPFMNENEHEHGNGEHDVHFGAEEGLTESKPNVSARPERVFLVLFVVIAILFFFGYLTLSGKKKDENDLKKDDSRVASAPIEPPPLPENPILEPPPVISPPPIPEPTKLEVLKPEEDSAAKNNLLDRMRSKMMISDSSGSLFGGSSSEKPASAASNDPNSIFQNNVIAANTKADRVEATHIGDLRKTIAQGRLIHATMESALNTDMPAPIRAIVSRDTYGEAGREPLIPKGSRLIGMYNTDISGAQSRVFVVWIRVIRPDGVDIQLGSPLVDAIGQAGVAGQVDTKFQSIFSRSILSSILTIGMAVGSDKISGGSTTTATSALGGSSTTGDASTTATVGALNRLGSVSDQFIQRFIDARPTILVDQGTQVNVFVNRDLVFPSEVTNGAKVVN